MRVLAVTTNASLVVALGSMMRDWEVVTVRDVERAVAEASGCAVALIDMGHSDDGVQAADELYRLGIVIPAVVIGDKPVEDARAQVLVRPFSLEELGTAVRRAAETPARQAPQPAPVAEAPTHAPPDVAPAAPPRRQAEQRTPEPPRQAPAASAAPVSKPQPPAAPTRPVAPEPPRRPLSVVRPEPAAEPRREPEPVVEPIPEAEAVAEEAPPAPPVEARPEPPMPARPEPPEPPRPHPVYHAAPARTEPAPAQPAASTASGRVEEEDAGGRWRRRRRGTPRQNLVPEETEPPVMRRLRAAAGNARELEALLDELPFLSDLPTLADGLIEEVAQELPCDVCSIFVPREAGYQVVGHRGLSNVEASMAVPETQPLFSDVLRTGEGIMIQPVDLAQGLVAGIGGARTEAMMAAPALVQGEVVAIVVAGGEHFTPDHLDRLSAIATEAAPGIAVAELLDRLRRRS